MSEYSDNLTVADVDAVLRALPDHEITGDEIALRFCGNTLEALMVLGQAVSFIAADGVDRDGRMIQ